MRKLALIAVLATLTAFGCAEQDPAVQEPPEATATSAPEINDKGTQTFTTEKFKAELELDDFYFEPTFIKSPGGATATITLHNESPTAAHTFTSEALNVDEELEPGAEKKVKVKIGTESRYEFQCRFHAAQGMRGAFQPH